MSEFSIIDRFLNMHYIIHSVRSLYKVDQSVLIQNLVTRFKIDRFGKIIIIFNYFWKKIHLKSLREF